MSDIWMSTNDCEATNDQTTKFTSFVSDSCFVLTFFFPKLIIISDPNSPHPPPTTPPPPPFLDANAKEQAYELTALTHMPGLQEFMVNAEEDIPDFMLTDGPFGFGYAVTVDGEIGQCLKRTPYAKSEDCTQDPATCKKGFSLSIWERVNISSDVFYTVHRLHLDEKRYVISTGGDEHGHPGVAIYHQGLALVALVSIGDKYWKLEVLGPVENGKWNNIAIRHMNSESKTGGLELYVNAIKVGQEHHSKDSSPRKAFLDPSEMLIGCHRDADNTAYRGHNSADFDEFAYWPFRLQDNQVVFFMGGADMSVDNIDPEEFEHMLDKTDMKNIAQAQIAVGMINSIASSLKPPDKPKPGNDTATTPAPVHANGTKPLDAVALNLRGMADALHAITNPGSVKNELSLKDMEIYMDIIEAASTVLNESFADQWHAIEDNGHRGAVGLKEDVERYVKTLGKNLKMAPKNAKAVSYTKFTDNILVKMDKMSIKDYCKIGKHYVSPKYRESREMRDYWLKLNTPAEKVFVPTGIVGCKEECNDYHVTVATVLYNSMEEVGPHRVDPDSLNPHEKNTLDSKIIKNMLNVYRPKEAKVTSSPPHCSVDGPSLQKHPVEFVGGHKVISYTIRHPTFHHDELETFIYQRYCVWWNPRIGKKGAWDANGCLLLKTTQFYTRCSCKVFGTYAIIAEHTEERIPPYEPDWVKGMKMFLYIISDICLLFYIIVVALAGDLKDQFHLSGMFLSACLIGGSIGMLLSDTESVQHDRHSCTAIGSLIQGFYMLSGLWVTMLGHAGFKATTKGIIAGRLQPYALLSFGVTMVVIGVSITFFIHDLGTDPRCFISWFDGAKLLLFFFPLAVCIGVSLFFACVIIFNVNHSKKLNKVMETDYSSFVSGATIAIIFFDITWILGAFSYVHMDEEYSGLYPIFQILNGLMGVIVLISLGFISAKFRGVLTRTSRRRGEIFQKMKDTARNAKGGKFTTKAQQRHPPSHPRQGPPLT